MKRTASAGNGSKSNVSSTKNSATKRKSSKPPQVAAALCVRNGGNGDLELRKLYKIVPDKKALADGFLRVIDESGEDYLYPVKYFAVVRVPASAAKALVG